MAEYSDVKMSGRMISRSWARPNDQGESVVAVFSVYEGDAPAGIAAPESWWSVCVYAYGKDGKCRNKYSPLQTERGGICMLDEAWLLAPTEGNLAKLSREVERRAGLA